MGNLSKEELSRYSRHLSLKDFGSSGQEKLKQSSVIVIGAGGLGCPALLYLTAAGIGEIGIVDFDTVQESNLQRQVLFSIHDIGKNKAEAAKERLSQLNPHVRIEAISSRISSTNAFEILKDFDIVVDGSDNFPTRYLLNDACILLNKPLVYGSVLEYEGQVSVFNVQCNTEYSANYRDIFPSPPPTNSVPNCEQAGVLGVLPGIIGSMQANEVLKLITGYGDTLLNKLLLFDAQFMEVSLIQIRNTGSRSNVRELIDYDFFCATPKNKVMKEITVRELQQLKQAGADFQLIDVREPFEYENGNLEGELIPMSSIPHQVEKIRRDKKVVVHCRSGSRSGQVIQWLEKTHNFENLYNLKGGIIAWAKEIDPTVGV